MNEWMNEWVGVTMEGLLLVDIEEYYYIRVTSKNARTVDCVPKIAKLTDAFE